MLKTLWNSGKEVGSPLDSCEGISGFSCSNMNISSYQLSGGLGYRTISIIKNWAARVIGSRVRFPQAKLISFGLFVYLFNWSDARGINSPSIMNHM